MDGKLCGVVKRPAEGKLGGLANRPTRDQLEEAGERTVRDLVGPGLQILFCGINPGRYSAATGHHFAGPGNRFWPTMYAAGFTSKLLQPAEDDQLLPLGFGITNLVSRTTARADLLTKQEMRAGVGSLHRKVQRFRPAILAFVGLGAYRIAFERPEAVCGLQDHVMATTRVWLLPNPSGLNAHHQGPALAMLFRALREFAACHIGG